MSTFPSFFFGGGGCPRLESGCVSTFRPLFFFVFWHPLLESGWCFSHIHFFCVWACPFLEKKVFYLIFTLRVHFFFFEDSHFCDIWKSGRFFLSAHFPPTFFFCRPLSPIVYSLHGTTEMKTRKNPYLSIFFFKNMLTSYEELQVTSIRKARKFQNCLTRSLKQKLLEPAGA